MINYPFPRPAAPPGCKNLPVTNMIQQVPYFHTYSHSQMCVQVYQSSGQTHNQESVGVCQHTADGSDTPETRSPHHHSSIGTPHIRHVKWNLFHPMVVSASSQGHTALGPPVSWKSGPHHACCPASLLPSPQPQASTPSHQKILMKSQFLLLSRAMAPLQSQQTLGTSWCLRLG